MHFSIGALAVLLTISMTDVVNAASGKATWYHPSAGIGACGTSQGDGEYVVAVSAYTYNSYPGAPSNPNKNGICKRHLKVNYKGKWIQVRVVDKCNKCGANDIDLSPAAFGALSGLGSGVIYVQWYFV